MVSYNQLATKVQSGDVLVDGSLIGDINEVVLKDREMLAAEGVVMLVVNIDARIKKLWQDQN